MSQDFGTQMGRRAGIQLAFMGAIFLVVGVGMYVALGGDPDAGATVTIMGIIFGLVGAVMAAVGFVLLRKAGGRARVEAAGVSGTARVMGLTQTGMYLNEQPQIGMDLEVSVLGMGTYRVEHKEFVPLLLLSRLQPGAVLAIRVNPASRHQIVIRWDDAPAGGAADAMTASLDAAIGGSTAGAPGSMVVTAPATGESLGQVAMAMAATGATGSSGVAAPFSSPDQAGITIDQLRAWLRANGLSGTARIDQLVDSGQTVGTDRLFTMQVTVEVPGHAPFRGPSSAAMVPLDKIGRIAVGVKLPVKVAPDNFDLCTFLWDQI